MFRHSMVEYKEKLGHYDNIDLVFNLDRHGSPKPKVDIYYAIRIEKYADKIEGGFKPFFKNDHTMMTSEEVMGMKPEQGGQKSNTCPSLLMTSSK